MVKSKIRNGMGIGSSSDRREGMTRMEGPIHELSSDRGIILHLSLFIYGFEERINLGVPSFGLMPRGPP